MIHGAPIPAERARRVDADVVTILSRAICDGSSLVLADQITDPGLYRRVAAVLKAAGGPWDTRRKAHVFADKLAADAIEPILVAGVVTLPPDLGDFGTPPALAAELVERAGVRERHRVLEPSAGEGAIVRPLLAAGAEVHAVEVDPKRHAVLRDLMGDPVPARCLRGDFLEQVSEPTFDRVLMNPPFAPRTMDVHHVRHAFHFLRPGGRAVMSAGTASRADGKTADLRDLVRGLGGTIEPLPDGSFEAAGTDVRTVVVTVTKPRGDAHA